jgi:hypothetical protein
MILSSERYFYDLLKNRLRITARRLRKKSLKSLLILNSVLQKNTKERSLKREKRMTTLKKVLNNRL